MIPNHGVASSNLAGITNLDVIVIIQILLKLSGMILIGLLDNRENCVWFLYFRWRFPLTL